MPPLALQDLVEQDSSGDMPNLRFYRNKIQFLPNGVYRLPPTAPSRGWPWSLFGTPPSGGLSLRQPHGASWRLLRALKAAQALVSAALGEAAQVN